MKIGIIGLAGSGKTTLFNALTGGTARTGGFGAAQVHVGVAQVVDPRVDRLAEIFRPKKKTYATVDFVDVPGMGQADPGGQGREAHREGEAIPQALEGADALLLVARMFDDPGVPHPRESVDPARDIADVRLDLILRDLAVVERRIARLEKTVPTRKDPAEAAELEALRAIEGDLEEGRPIRAAGLSAGQERRLRGFGFLTAKPLLVVVNAGEDQLGAAPEDLVPEGAADEAPPLVVCAKLEEELVQLPAEDRAAFLADYRLEGPASERVIRAAFALVGLHCFLTVGEDEVRAWPIRRGETALRAAGTIHSDLERGFIRAEAVSYEDFMAAGSLAAARERGVLRLEGKDYVVRDGDILNIRFNV